MADDDVLQAIDLLERHNFVMEKFGELGEKCQQLLELAIMQEQDADTIMEILEMGSHNYLYKRKSICKDKLVDLVRKDPRYKSFMP